MSEFKPFPKIPRLNRDCVITEKIDGTNAAIHIIPNETVITVDGHTSRAVGYTVLAQSRSRIITPGKGTDNMGFAAWVKANEIELILALGEGIHYGEWWGLGINRGYDLPEKRFSLFNSARWKDVPLPPILSVVPVLYEGPFSTTTINEVVASLAREGSKAAPGFMKPEGVVVYHTAANSMFKVTCEHDEQWKGKGL